MSKSTNKSRGQDSVWNDAFFGSFFVKNVQLSSLFTRKTNSGTAKNQLNKLLAESDKYTNTILGVVMYPALRWSLYGESITDVIDLAVSSGDAACFAETQQMLQEAFGFDNRLFLENREKYYTLCHEIIRELENAVQVAASHPEFGVQYQSVLQLIMDIEPQNGKSVSRFEISKYLPSAIELMHRLCGEKMHELIRRLIQSPLENVLDQSDENMYVYHNVKLLLREYSRLYWSNPDAADYTARILRSQTPKDILKCSELGCNLFSADVVLKFLLLITGAIALISYYPVNGNKYSMILRSLVSNRTIITPSGQSAYIREQELARLHNITPQKFSVMKQEAYALLGLLLWGYDGKVLMNILVSDKAKVFYFDA